MAEQVKFIQNQPIILLMSVLERCSPLYRDVCLKRREFTVCIKQTVNFFFLSERRAEEEHEAERSEREALLSSIEEHKRLEAENEERIKNRNVSYQRDLDMQIDYQRRVKSKEMEEEEREFRMGQVS